MVYKEAVNAATNEVRKSKRNVELKLAQHMKSDSKSFYFFFFFFFFFLFRCRAAFDAT